MKTNYLGIFLSIFLAIFLASYVNQCRMESSIEKYRRVAELHNGIAQVAVLRAHINELWAESGSLPCRMKDTDLEWMIDSAKISAPALRDVQLTGCGELTLTFTQASGVDAGTVVFRANLSPERDILWECSTEDFPKIGEYSPGCRYQH